MLAGSMPGEQLEGGHSGPGRYCHDPAPGPDATQMLEELSGQIGKLAPAALNPLEGLSGQIGKLAPTAFNEYVRDFWQRSVLFLDSLRQRGNQREEMLAHAALRS